MKDTNRYRIDVLLAVARITERSEVRENAIDEILLILPNVYMPQKHAGGRPNNKLESAKQDILQIMLDCENVGVVVYGGILRDEMLKRGHSDGTVNRAKSELIKDEIIIKTHNGKHGAESGWVYTFC